MKFIPTLALLVAAVAATETDTTAKTAATIETTTETAATIETATETKTETTAETSTDSTTQTETTSEGARGAHYYDDSKAQDYLSAHDAYVPLAKDFTDG